MMQDFTADQYRAAAEIALRDGGGELRGFAEMWEEKADQVDHFQNYVIELARIYAQHSGEPLSSVGFRLVTKLLADGWTMPKGMLG